MIPSTSLITRLSIHRHRRHQALVRGGMSPSLQSHGATKNPFFSPTLKFSPFLSPWNFCCIPLCMGFPVSGNSPFPLPFWQDPHAGKAVLKRAWVCKNCTFLLHKWDNVLRSHTQYSDRSKNFTNFLRALQSLWKSCSDQVMSTTDPLSLTGWVVSEKQATLLLVTSEPWARRLWCQYKGDGLTITSLEQNLSHRTTVTAYGSPENSTRDIRGDIFAHTEVEMAQSSQTLLFLLFY